MQRCREVRSHFIFTSRRSLLTTRYSCSHPQLLEMQLDVLYDHIGSASVVTSFPAFAKRLADNQLPHGAEVIIRIHARLLKERQSLPPTPTPPTIPSFPSSPAPQPAIIGLPPLTVKEAPHPTVWGLFSGGFAEPQPEESSAIGVSPVSMWGNSFASFNGKKPSAGKR